MHILDIAVDWDSAECGIDSFAIPFLSWDADVFVSGVGPQGQDVPLAKTDGHATCPDGTYADSAVPAWSENESECLLEWWVTNVLIVEAP